MEENTLKVEDSIIFIHTLHLTCKLIE